MGATPSKSPDWYPGEPAKLYGECACGQSATACFGTAGTSSPGRAAATTNENDKERDITTLPVVELTEMEFVANGAFCAVFTCKYQGYSVVAKRVRQDLPLSDRQDALDNLWTEHDCLRRLCHPNVIDVYGMWCRKGYEDWNEKDVCLLLERLALGTVGHLFGTIHASDRNLASHLAKSRLMKLLPFRSRLNRALELVLALEYLHGASGMDAIMHRDLKNMNVGFSQDGTLKLMDFGLSRSLPRGAENVNEEAYQMTGEVGSYRYMAPEIVKHEPYNAKADVYSWAILTWEMLAIEKPYAGVTDSTFIKRVVQDGERPALSATWPEQLRQIVAAAWHRDYRERPTASQIVVALKHISAQLPARRGGSCSRRRSATGGDGDGRRHSWAPVSSIPKRSGVRCKRNSGIATGSGDNSDIGSTVDDRDGSSNHSGGSGNGLGASSGDGGGPDNVPSDDKARKRFSFPTLPTLAKWSPSASSRSSSRRKSSYTSVKSSSSAPAVVAEDPDGDGCGGNDSDSGDDSRDSTVATSAGEPVESSSSSGTTKRSAVATAVGSVPADSKNCDAHQYTTPTLGAVSPGESRHAGRCPLHHGLIHLREEISNKLAAEAEAQTLSSVSRTRVRLPQDGRADVTHKTRREGSDTLERRAAPTSGAGMAGTARDAQPNKSTGVDSLESSVGVFERSTRHSGSAKKLWPTAPIHSIDPAAAAAAAAAAAVAAEAVDANRNGTLVSTPVSDCEGGPNGRTTSDSAPTLVVPE